MQVHINLFSNKKAQDKHPDYRGDGKDESGTLWEMAAWVKHDKNGKPYLSCVIKEKRDQQLKPYAPVADEFIAGVNIQHMTTPKPADEDSLPF